MKTSPSKKLFLYVAALALGIVGQEAAQAQLGGVPLWTNTYNGSLNGDDQARAMAVDGGGNVFVTGSSAGSGSGLDYATIKYSGAGVPLWTNLYNGGGNGDDVAKAIAVDGSGNVFVTGFSAGIGTGNDYATVAYSGAGVALWTNRFDGPSNGDDHALAVVVAGGGNVFVTGYCTGTNGNYETDYATIAYSGAGVALWTNRYNGTGRGSDQARAIAVDASGNVFVTGQSGGTNGYYNFATIKYSGAGIPLWTNRYVGTICRCSDYANAVAADRSGNVLVTGGSGPQFATIRYSGAGMPAWTNLGGGPGSPAAIVLDRSGNAFVTGDSHYHIGDSIYETIKYSASGALLWTTHYFSSFGNPSDYPTAMAVDASGNLFVTGYAGDSGFGGVHHYATVAYSPAGAQLWVNRYNGPAGADDRPTAVAVDSSGDVFVTGYSTGIGSGYDYVTIKYSSIPPTLTISRTPPAAVTLAWPSPSTDFTLQENTNGLAMVNWSNVVDTAADDGTTRSVIVNPPTGSRFYRLFHP